MIEFPFEERNSSRLGKIFKPIIPVALCGPQQTINIFVLLNSGADISLIPYSLGEILGLPVDMSKRHEIHGIGEGSIPYILSEVSLKVGEYQTKIRLGWALVEEVPFILGRLDFFDSFSIEFRGFENKIILTPALSKGQERESSSS